MVPLEVLFFIPSLFVTPAAVTALLWLRKGPHYSRLWKFAVVVCLLLVVIYTTLTLTTPLYSERDHKPDSPGGFSVSIFDVLGELIFWSCFAIPAFPVLIVLGCLPPAGRSRFWLLPLLLVVLVLAGLIAWKNTRYIADFAREKSRPRPSNFERFKHLRDNPNDAIDD